MILCITNTVAANFTANVLLSVGEKPAMIEDGEEAAELASVADAVLINIGTVTRNQAQVMRAAIAACRKSGTPWVLDPVGVQLLPKRLNLIREFIEAKPSLIRCNIAEFDCLCRKIPTFNALIHEGTGPSEPLKIQASQGACPLLATGRVDRVYGADGTVEEISGGVEMLQSVTATGCAQGAICAAFLGRGQAPRMACISASKLMKTAGERAFARSREPGGFQVALIDALHELSPFRQRI